MNEEVVKKKRLRLVKPKTTKPKPEPVIQALVEPISVEPLPDDFQEKEMIHYLLSTVKEVIEVSRRPVPLRDKNGQPTGSVEYQSATVLKACELMAKLMGSIKEPESKGVSVQIVSYGECGDIEAPE